MLYIRHRVNDPIGLTGVDKDHGVEIDLRADTRNPGECVVAHDPWMVGPNFSAWLDVFVRCGITGPVLLNTKEDGLEETLMKQMEVAGIQNYYFLDTVVPTLTKWIDKGQGKRFFIRFSGVEPIEQVLKFEGKADWVWADCLGGHPPNVTELQKIKKAFKVCLVSPELHGCPYESLSDFVQQLQVAEAVCTKGPHFWQKLQSDH